MRQQGSEAYSWEATEREVERQERAARPSFEVVTGGGLDARARQGVSPTFLARVKVVLAAAAVFVVLGAARVSLTVATVSVLQGSSELKTEISEAQTLGEELSVERSVLSSNSRISRIATQSYGMVPASAYAAVDASVPDESEAEAAADDAAEAEATEAVSGQAVDGDAAELADQAGVDAPLG